MTALPSSVSFTDSGITEAQFKTAITNQREFLAGLLGVDGEKITALATLGALGNDTVAKTANHTVTASERGVVFLCTGTFTLSLTAAATLGDGFAFVVKNIGSGSVTIDPNSTEQIDGESTKAIGQNESVIVFCNGTGFYSLGSSSYSGLTLEVFTSNDTWTVPSGITKAFVYVLAGGGAGGSAQYTGSRGGKGGNGGQASVYLTSLTGAYSITVGQGATAVAGVHGAYQAAGTASSFSSLISCTGGGGGQNIGTGVTGISGANGSASVSSGTQLVADSFPTPISPTGAGGAGAINPSTSTNVVGGSGSNGIIAIFY